MCDNQRRVEVPQLSMLVIFVYEYREKMNFPGLSSFTKRTFFDHSHSAFW